MMKKLIKFDGADMFDSIQPRKNWYDTDITIKSIDTGEVLFKGHNKVVIAGGDAVARKMFDLDTSDSGVIPTYNTELAIPDPGVEDPGAVYDFTSAKPGDPKVLLFCIGTDGCGTEGSQVYSVDYNSRIAPASIVPFRYPMTSADLTDELQETYTGRKVDGNYVAYYFKRFTAGPTLVRQYSDGTPIESNLYTTGLDVECYVDLTLTITKDDMREYFIATTGIDECKLNTISLCTAYPRKVNNKIYYMDIRPFTKLNMPNEYMIDVTKGIEVIYHIYF